MQRGGDLAALAARCKRDALDEGSDTRPPRRVPAGAGAFPRGVPPCGCRCWQRLGECPGYQQACRRDVRSTRPALLPNREGGHEWTAMTAVLDGSDDLLELVLDAAERLAVGARPPPRSAPRQQGRSVEGLGRNDVEIISRSYFLSCAISAKIEMESGRTASSAAVADTACRICSWVCSDVTKKRNRAERSGTAG
jgi:hypothetical protein